MTLTPVDKMVTSGVDTAKMATAVLSKMEPMQQMHASMMQPLSSGVGKNVATGAVAAVGASAGKSALKKVS